MNEISKATAQINQIIEQARIRREALIEARKQASDYEYVVTCAGLAITFDQHWPAADRCEYINATVRPADKARIFSRSMATELAKRVKNGAGEIGKAERLIDVLNRELANSLLLTQTLTDAQARS